MKVATAGFALCSTAKRSRSLRLLGRLSKFLERTRTLRFSSTGLGHSGIQPSVLSSKKRDLLGIIHKGLIGVGGVHLKLGECNPGRINAALKSEYARAKKAIDVCEGVHEKKIVEKVANLLSLEEHARVAYERMPLFACDDLQKAQVKVMDYLGSLTNSERKYVQKFFGDRVKKYI